MHELIRVEPHDGISPYKEMDTIELLSHFYVRTQQEGGHLLARNRALTKDPTMLAP